ncbi:MAG: Beta-lactamase [uncultured Chthoniobacterales bacterium]|uniref:beta-lactamase n=1 Tax=uncultured Chthoniobacterales bacterium TaxID=1836801 RepID=A0A6J4HBC7_9BACT|nr:MAG: Beta-lactamase [uncultured Chthoniobacterales bacterium]
MADDDRTEKLRDAIDAIAKEQKTIGCAVSVRDYNGDFRFGHHADRLFHAASTIKVAILLAVMKAVDEGGAKLEDALHVRNRFLSVVDGTPYKLDRSSDGYPQLYKSIGRTAKISELADSMITSSSNLATNLLLDFVGTDEAAKVLRDAGVNGVHLRRGVEDENAYDEGINNETTADGMVELFAVFRGDFLSKKSRDHAIHILLNQRFTSMIPAGLPAHATVAHKTGEISTVCHDAGIVYLPEREPYIVAILTEVDSDKNGRRDTVAKVSEVVYKAVTGKAK